MSSKKADTARWGQALPKPWGQTNNLNLPESANTCPDQEFFARNLLKLMVMVSFHSTLPKPNLVGDAL
jgi:hypothetical protein